MKKTSKVNDVAEDEETDVEAEFAYLPDRWMPVPHHQRHDMKKEDLILSIRNSSYKNNQSTTALSDRIRAYENQCKSD